jgi:hypothetical protein
MQPRKHDNTKKSFSFSCLRFFVVHFLRRAATWDEQCGYAEATRIEAGFTGANCQQATAEPLAG